MMMMMSPCILNYKLFQLCCRVKASHKRQKYNVCSHKSQKTYYVFIYKHVDKYTKCVPTKIAFSIGRQGQKYGVCR